MHLFPGEEQMVSVDVAGVCPHVRVSDFLRVAAARSPVYHYDHFRMKRQSMYNE